ncbi:MAG: class I SAM-dependent methyltransferase [Planctomycetota bacterium]
MSVDTVRVACAMCDASDAIPLFDLHGTSAVRCRRCGFAYVDPRASSAALAARLQEWSVQDIVDPERLRIAFEEGALSLYSRYLAGIERATRSGGRRLLDVGCATGALISVAGSRGWQAEGLEVGSSSAAYARDRLGLVVHPTSLFEFSPGPASYDAITFLEVIEHLEAPIAALRRIVDWIKPGGTLLLSTPNFDSLFRRIHGPRWWVVNCPDDHIVFFTPRTLRTALESVGLHVVSGRSRGFDIIGMLRAFGSSAQGAVAAPTQHHGYYKSRRFNESVKAIARSLRLARAARTVKRAIEGVCSSRISPLRHLGEQLVFLCAKPGR